MIYIVVFSQYGENRNVKVFKEYKDAKAYVSKQDYDKSNSCYIIEEHYLEDWTCKYIF